MNKKLDILFRLIAALLPPLAGRAGVGLLLLLTACSNDDILPADPGTEEVANQPYVELRIAVPLADSYTTRANPMGGEEGNGREQGVLKEDDINDINIYFYKEEEKTIDGNKVGLGMNSSDDTKILGHFFYNFKFPSDQNNSELLPNTELVEKSSSGNNSNLNYGTKYITLKFRCSEELLNKADGINFLAIANIGSKKTTENLENMTLGWLRGLDLSTGTASNSVSMNAKDIESFPMSTAYNDDYVYGGQHTGTNKITRVEAGGKESLGTSTLQRLYARLDLWYKEESNAVVDGDNVKELKYQIVDKDNKSLNNYYVYLTNVLPVNVMQTPSYLFKKVTDGLSLFNLSNFTTSTSYKWGGKESPSTTPTATSGNDRPENYVMERHTLDKQSIATINAWSEEDASAYDTSTLNTWYGNTRTSQVKTDIADVTKGKMSVYYHNAPASTSAPDYGCNHISIISYANENTHPTDCFHSNYLTGLAFRAVYVPETIYKEYSKPAEGTTSTGLTEMTNEDVTNFTIAQTTVESEKTKIYRYSPTAGKALKQLEKESIYFSDKNEAEEYATAHSDEMGIITPFNAIKHDGKLGFICYYNLWLRHYNDVNDTSLSNPHEALPMEYATVRNNIYRVAVEFSGPGDPEPTMRELDTMKARIFVRKWNFRPEDEFIFEL